MNVFADMDADTGLFLGLTQTGVLLSIALGLLAAGAHIARRRRPRDVLLRVLGVLLALTLVSLAGLFLSV